MSRADDYSTLRFQSRSGVGFLMLSRPAKRNAQNPQMWSELRALAGVSKWIALFVALSWAAMDCHSLPEST